MQDSKRVYTNPKAIEFVPKLSLELKLEVYTPNRRVARSIRNQHQSLYTRAIKLLETNGLRVATPLKAQSIFVETLDKTLKTNDVWGIAKAWRPTIQSILKSCPTLLDIPSSLSIRSSRIFNAAQAYQKALRESNLVDPNEIYWRASELTTIEPRPILVYGYFQPQPDELAWIQRLAASYSAFFLPFQESPLFKDVQRSIHWLEQQGWEINTHESTTSFLGDRLTQLFLEPSQTPSKSPTTFEASEDRSIQAYSYNSMEAEIRGTLTQIKILLSDDTPAKDIVIIARNEIEYGPKLIDIAWEYNIPFRALYGTPLLTTRLGAWLNQLIQVIEQDFPFEETAKLLSHPLFCNPETEFWSVVRKRHPQGLKQWMSPVQELLNLDLSAIANVNKTRRRDNWIQWWQALFQIFDLRRRCARWARESLAFNTVQEAMVELAKPESQKLSWPQFQQQFQSMLELLSVPAQPGRGGIELHSPQAIVGTQYRFMFVLGMAEGVLPTSIQNDPVLDFFERDQCRQHNLNLPTAQELAHRESLDFYALLQSAREQIIFSYPKIKGRQTLLPSTYLDRLRLTPQDFPKDTIASIEELRRVRVKQPQIWSGEDLLLPKIQKALEVEQHRESREAPNEFDGVIGISIDYTARSFSASQLTNLGQCPFKWFANKLLKLRAPDEQETEFTPRLRGELYHKVLEILIQTLKEDPTQSVMDPELLKQAFSSAEQKIGPINIPLWTIQREECLQALGQTIQQADFWGDDVEPIALEQDFQGEWYGLNVTGTIDRIDRTPNGLVLIDYKTSGSVPKGVKDFNGKASIDLQLPLYQDVAASALFPQEAIIDSRYYSLTKGKVIRPSQKAPQEQLPEVIEKMKSGVSQGCFPVQPDSDRHACRYCDFDMLCRQGSRLSRKDYDGTH